MTGIIMPPEKNVVSIRGEEVQKEEKVDLSRMAIAQQLKQIASDIEAENIPCPSYMVIMNGMENGQLHTYVLGQELNRVSLVGVLNTTATRVALGS